MCRIHLNLTCQVTPTTGVDQIQRVLLVYDKQTNGAALSLSDVLSTPSVDADMNLNNEMRFKLLVDDRYHLNAAAEPGSMRVIRHDYATQRMVRFNSGNAGTVADIATGSLYLIVIGSVVAGATAGFVSGRTRVRFTDC
jgi:hypothetical protein